MVNLKRLHLRIRGRVQGVFFRQSTQDQARRLGVLGYVRNLANGDVEAVAEANQAALDHFLAWCHRGPPFAQVENVEVERFDGTGEFDDFSIRYTGDSNQTK